MATEQFHWHGGGGRQRLGEGHQVEKHVKGILFLADTGFRDWDSAQLCTELGWNYRIRIACNTYLALPIGTTNRLDRLVPENETAISRMLG